MNCATKLPKPIFKSSLRFPSRVKSPQPSTSTASTSGGDPKNNMLRRRSKSLTELRPPMSRPPRAFSKLPSERQPLTVAKGLTKGPSVPKIGQKRPLPLIDEEPSKPKVAKVKIPDWDYKSRFQELEKKSTLMRSELKENRSKLANLKTIEEQWQDLQKDVVDKQEQIDVLEEENKRLKCDNRHLQKGLTRVKSELCEVTTSFENLSEKYEDISSKHKHNLEQCKDFLKRNSEQQAQLTQLRGEREMLQSQVCKLELLRRTQHNQIQDLKGNIRVFCRVRPPVSDDERSRDLCAIFCPDETMIEIRKLRESISSTGRPTDSKCDFTFDKVFTPEASQKEVFEELSLLVQSALDGYHVCVFAYGQTGSGKTYTMQGTSSNQGAIPRSVDLIFEKIEELQQSEWTYTVTASFLEIYNENIRDLLVPNSSHNYELRYNEGRGVTVTNLKVVSVNSAADLMHYVKEAHNNRAVATTDFNLHSSRSHSVIQIHLNGQNTQTTAAYCGSINLVDLAGSESAKTSAPDRLAETKNINKSLSALGNVMLALHNKDSHVPFRNSKLTFLLQSRLEGNSKTLVIVNISPLEDCYMESISSLRFAAKVKEIKMNAKRNRMLPVKSS